MGAPKVGPAAAAPPKVNVPVGGAAEVDVDGAPPNPPEVFPNVNTGAGAVPVTVLVGAVD